MNREQTKEVLSRVSVSFSKCFSRYTQEEKKYLIDEWYKSLYSYGLEDVNSAIDNYKIKNDKTPKVYNIVEELKLISLSKYKTVESYSKSGYAETDVLNKDIFQKVILDTFSPYKKMTLNFDLKESLDKKFNNSKLQHFIDMSWSYIRGAEFKVYHVEIALMHIRGNRFTVEDFMKAIVKASNESESMEANPNKLEAMKSMFKQMTTPEKKQPTNITTILKTA